MAKNKLVSSADSNNASIATQVLSIKKAKQEHKAYELPAWPVVGDVLVHLFASYDQDGLDQENFVSAALYVVDAVIWSDDHDDYVVQVNDDEEAATDLDGEVQDSGTYAYCYSKPETAVRNLDRLLKTLSAKNRRLMADQFAKVRECLQRSFP